MANIEIIAHKQTGLKSGYTQDYLHNNAHLFFEKDGVNVYVFDDSEKSFHQNWQEKSLNKLIELGGYRLDDESVLIVDVLNNHASEELNNIFFGSYHTGEIIIQDGEQVENLYIDEFLYNPFCWDKQAFLNNLFESRPDLLKHQEALQANLPDEFSEDN